MFHLILLLKLIVYAFALSSDLAFFALILDNPQKYHRCVGKGINGIRDNISSCGY